MNSTMPSDTPVFDMNEPECGHLFQAVSHILRRHCRGNFYHALRRDIAKDVFERIIERGKENAN